MYLGPSQTGCSFAGITVTAFLSVKDVRKDPLIKQTYGFLMILAAKEVNSYNIRNEIWRRSLAKTLSRHFNVTLILTRPR